MRPVARARKRWPVRRDKRCGAEGRGERGWDRLQEARGLLHTVLLIRSWGGRRLGRFRFSPKYHTWTLIISNIF